MAATVSAVASFFGVGGSAAAAGTALAAAEAIPMAAMSVAGADMAATAIAAGAAGGVGASLLKDAGGALLSGAGQAATGAVVSSLLAPKPPAAPKPTPMPDPLATDAARKKSIIEQTARRGRASTILTDSAGGDRLGG